MTHRLDHDEVTALLEAEAFAPSRGRKLLVGAALVLLIATLGYLLTTFLQSTRPPQDPLLSWQQGQWQPLHNPALLHCLQQWGTQHALPPPSQLIISQQAGNWSLVWLSEQGSDNFTLQGSVRELCP